jgi:hypothetical protein
MILDDNFVQLCQILLFLAFVVANLKIFCGFSASFEFRKFHSHNTEAMAKDKKVNIAVAS